MPTPSDQEDVLAEVASRGGDLAHLKQLARESPSQLQLALKALGYTKLGDRVRAANAIKDAAAAGSAAAPPVPAEEPSSAVAEAVVATVTPIETAEVADGAGTMVMHGAVVDIMDDGGLLKTVLRAGDKSSTTPPLLSKVKVRYIAAVLPECRRFEAKVLSFQFGEQQVPRGLEKCVATMQRGETCELVCRSEYAYGDEGRSPDVPAGASVRYELELISFVAPKLEQSELSAEDLVERAKALKADGARAFGSGLWLEAQVAYHEASRLLLTRYDEIVAPEGQEDASRKLIIACELNIAQCALKREEWFAADKACTSVLERLSDPMGTEREQNMKALFRRAKARIGRSEFKKARADVKAAHAINPNSRELQELWASIKERQETATTAQGHVYAQMTSKLIYKEYNVAKKKFSSYPRVYFDVTMNGERLTRIVFELFTDRAPKTCENFRALCTGEKGTSPSGTRLHYKGSRFHRAVNVDDGPPEFLNESQDGTGRVFEVWKGFLIHGGDITHGDGTGGESIYGGPFEDELCLDYVRHTAPGLLSMAGSTPMRSKEHEEMMHVPNNNTSQFFITTKARTHALGGCTILHFDGRHVVFGRVVEGMGSVHKIQKAPHDPLRGHYIVDDYQVVITDCGQLKSKEEEELEREEREFQALNPVFMIPDKKEDEVEHVTRATWAQMDAAEELPPRPPPPMPTEADLAIASAEIEDDD